MVVALQRVTASCSAKSGPLGRPLPRLHVLASEAELARPDRFSAVLEKGGPEVALHLRASTMQGARLFDAASWIMERCRDQGSLFIVNDRLDVALAVGAGGVHLKSESMASESARRIGGSRLVLGRSVHQAGEAGNIGRPPLDYLVLGSAFPTLSHPDRPALPATAPRNAAVRSSIPVLAIGGVTPGRASVLVEAGIYGAVVFRGIWEADRPREAVSAYLEVLSRGNR